MRLLLDTHILLWKAITPGRLTTAMRETLDDPANLFFFSTASIWEIAIKQSLGRGDFDADPRRLRQGLLQDAYTELPVLGEHAIAVAALPQIHKDPFDRMLVAQAMVEGIDLLTVDRQLARYQGPVRLF